MTTYNFWQVDAFTDRAFKGNPAAVMILKEQMPDALMLEIAQEMNLSETAYILERDGQPPLLRWFTPAVEMDLCGHATLASAHIYLNNFCKNQQSVTFDTVQAGLLTVEKKGELYQMNFPARAGENVPISNIPQCVFDALPPVKPIEARKARDLMLIYEDENIVRNMAPDFNTLMKYPDPVIISAKSDAPEYDFISRYFCPNDAIAEDPVTGSAHCTLTPYWSGKLGKDNLTAYQASKRGGELFLEMKDDRILISGKAITVIEGQITI